MTLDFFGGIMAGTLMTLFCLKCFLAGCNRSEAPQNELAGSVRSSKESGHCPVANNVALQVLRRAEVGLVKYGVSVARTDLSKTEWLQHLQEELLDGAVYIERLKQEISSTGEDAQAQPSSDDTSDLKPIREPGIR